MLCRKIIKRQQLLPAFLQAFRGRRIFISVGFQEQIKRFLGVGLRVGHPDLPQCIAGAGGALR